METNYEILKKYSSGLCSEEEKKEVYRAVQNDFSLCFNIIQMMQIQAMAEICERPGAANETQIQSRPSMSFYQSAETSIMEESTSDVAKYAPIPESEFDDAKYLVVSTQYFNLARTRCCKYDDDEEVKYLKKRSFSKEDFVEFFKRVIRYIKSRE